MNYFENFKMNMIVVLKCLHAAIWHFIHGVIPCKLTSHEYWRIDFDR